MTPSKLSVVVGGQLGSEGKGAVTAFLGSTAQNPDTRVYGVRVAGPNAGHTVLGNCPNDSDTRMTELCYQLHPQTNGMHPWRLRQVPVTAVSNPDSVLVLAAGSEVDPLVLVRELQQLDSAGYRASSRITLDAAATIIEPRHQQAEADAALTERIGSTGKGIGAARQERLARVARTVQDWSDELQRMDSAIDVLQEIVVGHTTTMLNQVLAADENAHVLIEGTQGYGLGLHTSNYPQVTSSDCRAIDFLAMAGISPWVVDMTDPDRFAVWVVFRTYPIRVAGNSGPLHGETSWERLGLAAELTTVTQKVRRVGDWDPALAQAAVQANGGGLGTNLANVVHTALTMADYIVPELAGCTIDRYHELSDLVHVQTYDLISRVGADTRVMPSLVGTGPDTMIDLRGRNVNPDDRYQEVTA